METQTVNLRICPHEGTSTAVDDRTQTMSGDVTVKISGMNTVRMTKPDEHNYFLICDVKTFPKSTLCFHFLFPP